MKILIAEDDAVSRRVLEGLLKKWSYEVFAVANGADAWAMLETDDSLRIAILDWMMPEMEGTEICRRVRAQNGRAYIFLILLTAQGRKQNLLLGLKAGADDYLSKPFDAEELRARLEVGERILRVQDELIAARNALHFEATHDVLTGIASRGAAIDFLMRELARSRRERTSVGVVLADIDHFKKINDEYGHLAGDAVLQQVAQRMIQSVRRYDCVGRYGGEEFLMIFPSSNEHVALRQAERIRREIEASPMRTPEGNISLTMSFGISATELGSEASATELLRDADVALYRAKKLGRNRCEQSKESRRGVLSST